ncbi:MAG: DsbE family thiol:disulfide interchange protein [Rhodobacterales bacterium CG_4_9_14_3_um_filter_71_31]|nr:MAG: DsbE family thiol:disulfide interchange protein [Rhodobacterales bacterium CG_4_9_14_3_um_filter_71_31]
MSDTTDGKTGGGWGRFIPLAIFLALAAMLAGYLIATTMFGYQRNTLPSTMIGRAAPVMTLPPLNEGQPPLDHAALTAPGVKLVNVWASWCGPCRIEHPFLMALKERGVTVHGVNYRDEPANARRFLGDLGDPYALIGVDKTGRAGVEWGVYGVPETFVINGAGEIVYKHVGPIQNSDLEKKILPAIAAAGG